MAAESGTTGSAGGGVASPRGRVDRPSGPPAGRPAAAAIPFADRVDRPLELLDHGLGDRRVLQPAARLDDAREDDRDQQDQADVLDRPLPARLARRARQRRVQPSLQFVVQPLHR
jgi:hypothetical protein